MTFGVWADRHHHGHRRGARNPHVLGPRFRGHDGAPCADLYAAAQPVHLGGGLVAACAAVAAYALPMKLNIVVAIAAAVAFGVLADRARPDRAKL